MAQRMSLRRHREARMRRWRFFVRARLWPLEIGVRVGRHYWYFRRDPLGIYSELYRIGCRYWDIGRWRLTHRWEARA